MKAVGARSEVGITPVQGEEPFRPASANLTGHQLPDREGLDLFHPRVSLINLKVTCKQLFTYAVIGYKLQYKLHDLRGCKPPIHITVPYVNQTPPGLDKRGPPTMQRYQ